MSRRVHNVRFYKPEPRAIHCFAYERKLRALALSRSDGSIEVWNLSHAPYIERTIPGRVNSFVESLTWCKRRLFSVGLQGSVTEYDLQKLSIKYEISVTAGPCWCLASNRENTHLAVGSEDGHIHIFMVTEEGLLFEKKLDKQEGRILCLSWDRLGEVIVTGSVDAIRVWNVETGHAVHRMIPGRGQKNRETIVWCLTVTEDLTIISGDSRGRITFWDGNVGSQLESFQSHKADILCLALSEDENSVYCAGVDPLIVSFSKVYLKVGSKRTNWVKSIQRRIHDHDVRALTLHENKLMSAGVDSYLAISSYPPKMLVKYPPFFQFPCVAVCPEARNIMLRYTSHLEVWRLGSASVNEDIIQEGVLPLIEDTTQLLTLKSRGDDAIVCADMSSKGNWLAYSTVTALNFYKFEGGNKPSLQKAPYSFEIATAHRIKFLPNNSQVVVATCTGDIALIQLSGEELILKHVCHALKDKLILDAIRLLIASQDGQYIIAADHRSSIVVWSTTNLKHYCSLPRYKCPPTSIGIHPSSNELVVVYNDHKIIEYSLSERKYTRFSAELKHKHPAQWLGRGCAVTNITFDPNNKDIILLQDDNTICVINKKKELPEVEAKIPRIGSPISTSDSLDGSHPRTSIPDSAFHVIKKYKHLIHLEWLDNGELVAVEVSPLTLTENLPPSLKQKKFGGM